ncbi:hypothetical protein ACVWW2_002702 [Bradyrhizobium sp. LM4.3]
MLDRCPADLLADCRSEILRPAGSPGDHLSDRAGRDGHAKQIGEDLPEPIFRQKLSRRQIGHHSGQPDAILRRRPYLGWKRSCRDRATAAAFATIELMLRDEQRRRRRQIEHLTAADKFQLFTLQRHSAAPASDRAMHDRMIDPFGPLQVFACMAGLAAGLLQTLAHAGSVSGEKPGPVHRSKAACCYWSCPDQADAPDRPHAPSAMRSAAPTSGCAPATPQSGPAGRPQTMRNLAASPIP